MYEGRCARARILRNSQRYFKDSESVVKLLSRRRTAGKRSNIGEGGEEEEEEEERRPRESDGRSLKIGSRARVMPLRLFVAGTKNGQSCLTFISCNRSLHTCHISTLSVRPNPHQSHIQMIHIRAFRQSNAIIRVK